MVKLKYLKSVIEEIFRFGIKASKNLQTNNIPTICTSMCCLYYVLIISAKGCGINKVKKICVNSQHGRYAQVCVLLIPMKGYL